MVVEAPATGETDKKSSNKIAKVESGVDDAAEAPVDRTANDSVPPENRPAEGYHPSADEDNAEDGAQQ